MSVQEYKFRVTEIFRSIQGEGYFTGYPALFVRFHGCNLTCPFCDTKQSWEHSECWTAWTADELLAEIDKQRRPKSIVVFTGGEPTLQQIVRLMTSGRGYRIHLETNGTLPVPREIQWTTLSPKKCTEVYGRPYYVNPVAMEKACELKWLIDSEEDVVDLQDFIEEHKWRKWVTVQPVWHVDAMKTAYATKVAYDAALTFGWRLSLQMHKYINVK